MPAPKRSRREPTESWEQLRLFASWPEQETYELLRPIVLFGQTAGERATVTGVSERTLDRKADRFDAAGMASLFDNAQQHAAAQDRRSLPATSGSAFSISRRSIPPSVLMRLRKSADGETTVASATRPSSAS
jgi:hypothetical protein